MKGFLLRHWQALPPSIRQNPPCPSGQHRISHTIAALREFTDGIWKDRNNVLHKHANKEPKRIRSLADSEIRHYHANPALLPPHD
jgi:hypothetical protein